MELNTRGRYAVMAMADIANHTAVFGSERAIPLSEVAARQHLPLSYLEQLFGKLREAGLVESVRGRSGGYRLKQAADEIAIVTVLEAAEEPTRMTRCVGGKGTGCVGEQRCLTHGLWSALGRHIHEFLADVTLADVINDNVAASKQPGMRSVEVPAHE
jgi:Rrf2 family transcriptional regulator, iron-sulfur cluster assembly transcription factor